MRTSLFLPFLPIAFPSNLLELVEMPVFKLICSHRLGKIVNIPITINIDALIPRRMPPSNPRAFDVPWISNVKTAIDTSRDATTVKALLELTFVFGSVDAPSSIGSNGKIQGARIVKIPAINDTNTSCSSKINS